MPRFHLDTRGGLARPQGRPRLDPSMSPLGPEALVQPLITMPCPHRRPARICGRTECVSPRKTALRVSPGSSPLGRLPLARPPGGAGSARPQGRHRAKPKIASYWPPAYRKRTGENAMPRLESGLRTRTHGVRPSEKTAPRAFSGRHLSRPDTIG